MSKTLIEINVFNNCNCRKCSSSMISFYIYTPFDTCNEKNKSNRYLQFNTNFLLLVISKWIFLLVQPN